MKRRNFLFGLVSSAAATTLVSVANAKDNGDGSLTLADDALELPTYPDEGGVRVWPCKLTLPNGDIRPFLVSDDNLRKMSGQRYQQVIGAAPSADDALEDGGIVEAIKYHDDPNKPPVRRSILKRGK